jgi:hypothetical protein
LLLLACHAAHAQPLPAPAGQTGQARPLVRWLEVKINGRDMDEPVAVAEVDGELLAPAEALATWRLTPQDAPRPVDGRAHHGLGAWQPRVVAATQTLWLTVDASAFVPFRQAWGAGRPAGQVLASLSWLKL